MRLIGPSRTHRPLRLALLLALAMAHVTYAPLSGDSSALEQERPPRRIVHVVGRDYRFSPAQIVVGEGDIVQVTFEAADIAHSFAVDDYRIAKRAGAGRTVVFEFRALRSGRFPFYCNLTIDDRCQQMRGELVVEAR